MYISVVNIFSGAQSQKRKESLIDMPNINKSPPPPLTKCPHETCSQSIS